MKAAKFSAFLKNFFVALSLFALASLPANAALAIGISFPSQGGEDDATEIDESLLTLPKLHLQETPCFWPETRTWSSDPMIKFGTTYSEVRTYIYPHQGPTSTIFVFTNSFTVLPAKFNQIVSSYFTGLTVPEQRPAPSLSGSVSAKGTHNSSAASDSSISDSVPIVVPEPANGILNLRLEQNTLQLDWPADYIGWNLQAQTNPGINSQWYPIPGSSLTNHLDLTLDRANTSVFFRLIAP
jgi:hypothetical protein